MGLFVVSNVICDVFEDSFKEGFLEHINSYDFSLRDEEYSSVKDALKHVLLFGFAMTEEESENYVKRFVYDDETKHLSVDILLDENEKYVSEDSGLYEDYKNGEINLFNCSISVLISKLTSFSEEDIKDFKIV